MANNSGEARGKQKAQVLKDDPMLKGEGSGGQDVSTNPTIKSQPTDMSMKTFVPSAETVARATSFRIENVEVKPTTKTMNDMFDDLKRQVSSKSHPETGDVKETEPSIAASSGSPTDTDNTTKDATEDSCDSMMAELTIAAKMTGHLLLKIVDLEHKLNPKTAEDLKLQKENIRIQCGLADDAESVVTISPRQ
ncbi:hypothetical protein LTR56_001963 [Elasticomyces elasticus]|nr:hypothetical protein LTR22_011549 [Elasticomyces elasticus]KAK3658107.1 hypothetical protein LTR56_001963 [Elasticomyces elasticus]KAK4914906.1 hypothetical protein LTR49_016895 [Elasticomyces elasticus]